MFPGMGGKGSPRQMNQLMRRLGIQVKEIPDVQEVVIKTSTKAYTFRDAEVTLMDAQGQKTYQLTGKATVRDLTPEEKEKLGATATPTESPVEDDEGEEAPIGSLEDVALDITDEDVALVASQTGSSPKDARAALEQAGGDIAEAILKLKGE
jgi:nascent polypeptide-associated complex subunit alpha